MKYLTEEKLKDFRNKFGDLFHYPNMAQWIENEIDFAVSEAQQQVKVEPEVKPANGINISEDKECDSIILEKNGLRYECYFDKKYHQIFVGKPQAGSLISIGTPENPTGTLKVEYYPKF